MFEKQSHYRKKTLKSGISLRLLFNCYMVDAVKMHLHGKPIGDIEEEELSKTHNVMSKNFEYQLEEDQRLSFQFTKNHQYKKSGRFKSKAIKAKKLFHQQKLIFLIYQQLHTDHSKLKLDQCYIDFYKEKDNHQKSKSQLLLFQDQGSQEIIQPEKEFLLDDTSPMSTKFMDSRLDEKGKEAKLKKKREYQLKKEKTLGPNDISFRSVVDAQWGVRVADQRQYFWCGYFQCCNQCENRH